MRDDAESLSLLKRRPPITLEAVSSSHIRGLSPYACLEAPTEAILPELRRRGVLKNPARTASLIESVCRSYKP
jgi:hypothetical protein